MQQIDLHPFRHTDFQLVDDSISIRNIRLEDAEAIAVFRADDTLLHKAAGMRRKRCSAQEVLDDWYSWQKEHNAICMGIVLDGVTTVGTISLSHIDETNRTAGIGYWLGSAYWGRGYCSAAFDLTLTLAQRLNIRQVSSKIEKTNQASRRIWLRRGGVEHVLSETRIRYTIDLKTEDTYV